MDRDCGDSRRHSRPGYPGYLGHGKQYSIPKTNTATSQMSQTSLPADSTEGKRLGRVVKNCFLDHEYEGFWKLADIQIIHNKKLEEEYAEKKKEKKQEKHDKDIQEWYCFVRVAEEQVMAIVHQGLVVGRDADYHKIGDSQQGIYVCRHPDILLRYIHNMKNKKFCKILMCRVLTSRRKQVHARNEPLCPTPDYDGHVSAITAKKDDPIEKQLEKSQLYLYEYTDEALPAMRPRHCLPHALLTYEREPDRVTPAMFSLQGLPFNSGVPRRDLETGVKHMSLQGQKSSVWRESPASTNRPVQQHSSYPRKDSCENSRNPHSAAVRLGGSNTYQRSNSYGGRDHSESQMRPETVRKTDRIESLKAFDPKECSRDPKTVIRDRMCYTKQTVPDGRRKSLDSSGKEFLTGSAVVYPGGTIKSNMGEDTSKSDNPADASSSLLRQEDMNLKRHVDEKYVMNVQIKDGNITKIEAASQLPNRSQPTAVNGSFAKSACPIQPHSQTKSSNSSSDGAETFVESVSNSAEQVRLEMDKSETSVFDASQFEYFPDSPAECLDLSMKTNRNASERAPDALKNIPPLVPQSDLAEKQSTPYSRTAHLAAVASSADISADDVPNAELGTSSIQSAEHSHFRVPSSNYSQIIQCDSISNLTGEVTTNSSGDQPLRSDSQESVVHGGSGLSIPRSGINSSNSNQLQEQQSENCAAGNTPAFWSGVTTGWQTGGSQNQSVTEQHMSTRQPNHGQSGSLRPPILLQTPLTEPHRQANGQSSSQRPPPLLQIPVAEPKRQINLTSQRPPPLLQIPILEPHKQANNEQVNSERPPPLLQTPLAETKRQPNVSSKRPPLLQTPQIEPTEYCSLSHQDTLRFIQQQGPMVTQLLICRPQDTHSSVNREVPGHSSTFRPVSNTNMSYRQPGTGPQPVIRQQVASTDTSHVPPPPYQTGFRQQVSQQNVQAVPHGNPSMRWPSAARQPVPQSTLIRPTHPRSLLKDPVHWKEPGMNNEVVSSKQTLVDNAPSGMSQKQLVSYRQHVESLRKGGLASQRLQVLPENRGVQEQQVSKDSMDKQIQQLQTVTGGLGTSDKLMKAGDGRLETPRQGIMEQQDVAPPGKEAVGNTDEGDQQPTHGSAGLRLPTQVVDYRQSVATPSGEKKRCTVAVGPHNDTNRHGVGSGADQTATQQSLARSQPPERSAVRGPEKQLSHGNVTTTAAKLEALRGAGSKQDTVAGETRNSGAGDSCSVTTMPSSESPGTNKKTTLAGVIDEIICGVIRPPDNVLSTGNRARDSEVSNVVADTQLVDGLGPTQNVADARIQDAQSPTQTAPQVDSLRRQSTCVDTPQETKTSGHDIQSVDVAKNLQTESHVGRQTSGGRVSPARAKSPKGKKKKTDPIMSGYKKRKRKKKATPSPPKKPVEKTKEQYEKVVWEKPVFKFCEDGSIELLMEQVVSYKNISPSSPGKDASQPSYTLASPKFIYEKETLTNTLANPDTDMEDTEAYESSSLPDLGEQEDDGPKKTSVADSTKKRLSIGHNDSTNGASSGAQNSSTTDTSKLKGSALGHMADSAYDGDRDSDDSDDNDSPPFSPKIDWRKKQNDPKFQPFVRLKDCLKDKNVPGFGTTEQSLESVFDSEQIGESVAFSQKTVDQSVDEEAPLFVISGVCSLQNTEMIPDYYENLHVNDLCAGDQDHSPSLAGPASTSSDEARTVVSAYTLSQHKEPECKSNRRKSKELDAVVPSQTTFDTLDVQENVSSEVIDPVDLDTRESLERPNVAITERHAKYSSELSDGDQEKAECDQRMGSANEALSSPGQGDRGKASSVEISSGKVIEDATVTTLFGSADQHLLATEIASGQVSGSLLSNHEIDSLSEAEKECVDHIPEAVTRGDMAASHSMNVKYAEIVTVNNLMESTIETDLIRPEVPNALPSTAVVSEMTKDSSVKAVVSCEMMAEDNVQTDEVLNMSTDSVPENQVPEYVQREAEKIATEFQENKDIAVEGSVNATGEHCGKRVSRESDKDDESVCTIDTTVEEDARTVEETDMFSEARGLIASPEMYQRRQNLKQVTQSKNLTTAQLEVFTRKDQEENHLANKDSRASDNSDGVANYETVPVPNTTNAQSRCENTEDNMDNMNETTELIKGCQEAENVAGSPSGNTENANMTESSSLFQHIINETLPRPFTLVSEYETLASVDNTNNFSGEDKSDQEFTDNSSDAKVMDDSQPNFIPLRKDENRNVMPAETCASNEGSSFVSSLDSENVIEFLIQKCQQTQDREEQEVFKRTLNIVQKASSTMVPPEELPHEAMDHSIPEDGLFSEWSEVPKETVKGLVDTLLEKCSEVKDSDDQQALTRTIDIILRNTGMKSDFSGKWDSLAPVPENTYKPPGDVRETHAEKSEPSPVLETFARNKNSGFGAQVNISAQLVQTLQARIGSEYDKIDIGVLRDTMNCVKSLMGKSHEPQTISAHIRTILSKFDYYEDETPPSSVRAETPEVPETETPKEVRQPSFASMLGNINLDIDMDTLKKAVTTAQTFQFTSQEDTKYVGVLPKSTQPLPVETDINFNGISVHGKVKSTQHEHILEEKENTNSEHKQIPVRKTSPQKKVYAKQRQKLMQERLLRARMFLSAKNRRKKKTADHEHTSQSVTSSEMSLPKRRLETFADSDDASVGSLDDQNKLWLALESHAETPKTSMTSDSEKPPIDNSDTTLTRHPAESSQTEEESELDAQEISRTVILEDLEDLRILILRELENCNDSGRSTPDRTVEEAPLEVGEGDGVRCVTLTGKNKCVNQKGKMLEEKSKKSDPHKRSRNRDASHIGSSHHSNRRVKSSNNERGHSLRNKERNERPASRERNRRPRSRERRLRSRSVERRLRSNSSERKLQSSSSERSLQSRSRERSSQSGSNDRRLRSRSKDRYHPSSRSVHRKVLDVHHRRSGRSSPEEKDRRESIGQTRSHQRRSVEGLTSETTSDKKEPFSESDSQTSREGSHIKESIARDKHLSKKRKECLTPSQKSSPENCKKMVRTADTHKYVSSKDTWESDRSRTRSMKILSLLEESKQAKRRVTELLKRSKSKGQGKTHSSKCVPEKQISINSKSKENDLSRGHEGTVTNLEPTPNVSHTEMELNSTNSPERVSLNTNVTVKNEIATASRIVTEGLQGKDRPDEEENQSKTTERPVDIHVKDVEEAKMNTSIGMIRVPTNPCSNIQEDISKMLTKLKHENVESNTAMASKISLPDTSMDLLDKPTDSRQGSGSGPVYTSDSCGFDATEDAVGTLTKPLSESLSNINRSMVHTGKPLSDSKNFIEIPANPLLDAGVGQMPTPGLSLPESIMSLVQTATKSLAETNMGGMKIPTTNTFSAAVMSLLPTPAESDTTKVGNSGRNLGNGLQEGGEVDMSMSEGSEIENEEPVQSDIENSEAIEKERERQRHEDLKAKKRQEDYKTKLFLTKAQLKHWQQKLAHLQAQMNLFGSFPPQQLSDDFDAQERKVNFCLLECEMYNEKVQEFGVSQTYGQLYAKLPDELILAEERSKMKSADGQLLILEQLLTQQQFSNLRSLKVDMEATCMELKKTTALDISKIRQLREMLQWMRTRRKEILQEVCSKEESIDDKVESLIDRLAWYRMMQTELQDTEKDTTLAEFAKRRVDNMDTCLQQLRCLQGTGEPAKPAEKQVEPPISWITPQPQFAAKSTALCSGPVKPAAAAVKQGRPGQKPVATLVKKGQQNNRGSEAMGKDKTTAVPGMQTNPKLGKEGQRANKPTQAVQPHPKQTNSTKTETESNITVQQDGKPSYGSESTRAICTVNPQKRTLQAKIMTSEEKMTDSSQDSTFENTMNKSQFDVKQCKVLKTGNPKAPAAKRGSATPEVQLIDVMGSRVDLMESRVGNTMNRTQSQEKQANQVSSATNVELVDLSEVVFVPQETRPQSGKKKTKIDLSSSDSEMICHGNLVTDVSGICEAERQRMPCQEDAESKQELLNGSQPEDGNFGRGKSKPLKSSGAEHGNRPNRKNEQIAFLEVSNTTKLDIDLLANKGDCKISVARDEETNKTQSAATFQSDRHLEATGSGPCDPERKKEHQTGLHGELICKGRKDSFSTISRQAVWTSPGKLSDLASSSLRLKQSEPCETKHDKFVPESVEIKSRAVNEFTEKATSSTHSADKKQRPVIEYVEKCASSVTHGRKSKPTIEYVKKTASRKVSCEGQTSRKPNFRNIEAQSRNNLPSKDTTSASKSVKESGEICPNVRDGEAQSRGKSAVNQETKKKVRPAGRPTTNRSESVNCERSGSPTKMTSARKERVSRLDSTGKDDRKASDPNVRRVKGGSSSSRSRSSSRGPREKNTHAPINKKIRYLKSTEGSSELTENSKDNSRALSRRERPRGASGSPLHRREGHRGSYPSPLSREERRGGGSHSPDQRKHRSFERRSSLSSSRSRSPPRKFRRLSRSPRRKQSMSRSPDRKYRHRSRSPMRRSRRRSRSPVRKPDLKTSRAYGYDKYEQAVDDFIRGGTGRRSRERSNDLSCDRSTDRQSDLSSDYSPRSQDWSPNRHGISRSRSRDPSCGSVTDSSDRSDLRRSHSPEWRYRSPRRSRSPSPRYGDQYVHGPPLYYGSAEGMRHGYPVASDQAHHPYAPPLAPVHSGEGHHTSTYYSHVQYQPQVSHYMPPATAHPTGYWQGESSYPVPHSGWPPNPHLY